MLAAAACCLLSIARVDGFDVRELRLGDNAAAAAELLAIVVAEIVFGRAVNGANIRCCC